MLQDEHEPDGKRVKGAPRAGVSRGPAPGEAVEPAGATRRNDTDGTRDAPTERPRGRR